MAAGAVADVKPRPVVIGYSSSWRDQAAPPADYDYSTLTMIARAFVGVKADGSTVVPEGYFNPEMEKLARAYGVKLLLSIGGGGASGADWLAMASNPTSRAHFIDELGKLMAEHQYDGVDIDWEPPEPTKQTGEAYGALLKAMRAKFPKAVLTTALNADHYQAKFTPWPDVIASLDYINLMAYDYSGPWSGIAGHTTNLFPAGDYKGAVDHSVAEGLKNLISEFHVPPAKVLMGMNFWGYRFRTDTLGGPFAKNAPNVSDALTLQQTQALFYTGRYESRWDAAANQPYLVRIGGGSVICYDDAESIRRKCEYAASLGCGGFMVWNLGSDAAGAQTPLMDAATTAFGGTPHALSRLTLEAQIAQAAEMAKDAPSGSAPAPAVPGDLSKLSVKELVDLNAKLQQRAGFANDAKWMAAK